MADVTLTITAKNGHVPRIMDALNNSADKKINIAIDGGYDFQWSFPPKGSRTSKEFAQDFIKDFTRAFVRCYEFDIDVNRFDGDVDNINKPSQNVPDGIVE